MLYNNTWNCTGSEKSNIFDYVFTKLSPGNHPPHIPNIYFFLIANPAKFLGSIKAA